MRQEAHSPWDVEVPPPFPSLTPKGRSRKPAPRAPPPPGSVHGHGRAGLERRACLSASLMPSKRATRGGEVSPALPCRGAVSASAEAASPGAEKCEVRSVNGLTRGRLTFAPRQRSRSREPAAGSRDSSFARSPLCRGACWDGVRAVGEGTGGGRVQQETWRSATHFAGSRADREKQRAQGKPRGMRRVGQEPGRQVTL